MRQFEPNKPNEELQARLRREIKVHGLASVSRGCKIDHRTLLRYLANLPMSAHAFQGIEAITASAMGKDQPKAQPPSANSTEAEDGLFR